MEVICFTVLFLSEPQKFTTSSRGTAEQNLKKGKGEYCECFLKENPQGFPVPCEEGRGQSDPCERNKDAASPRPAVPQAALPLAPSHSCLQCLGHASAAPAHTKTFLQDKAAPLPCCLDDQQKSKHLSNTALKHGEKKMAVSKSQLLHLEKHAFHKSGHFNPISLKATKINSLDPFSPPFLHLFNTLSQQQSRIGAGVEITKQVYRSESKTSHVTGQHSTKPKKAPVLELLHLHLLC